MSDYRITTVKHNGIDCIRVIIDAEPLVVTHIPIDDLLKLIAPMRALPEESAQTIIRWIHSTQEQINTSTESDWMGLCSVLMDDIETLCKSQQKG